MDVIDRDQGTFIIVVIEIEDMVMEDEWRDEWQEHKVSACNVMCVSTELTPPSIPGRHCSSTD